MKAFAFSHRKDHGRHSEARYHSRQKRGSFTQRRTTKTVQYTEEEWEQRCSIIDQIADLNRQLDHSNFHGERIFYRKEPFSWVKSHVTWMCLYFALVTAFMLIGTWVFQAFEIDHGDHLLKLREEKIEEIMEKWSISDDDWEEFEEDVTEFAGYPTENPWRNGAIVYQLLTDISTTVGYGNVTPATEAGQLWFVFISYCCISSALLLYLEIYGLERSFFKITLRFLNKRCGIYVTTQLGLAMVHMAYAFFYFFVLISIGWMVDGQSEAREHPWVTDAYAFQQYWTTVGFGDVPIVLKDSLFNIPCMILLSMFAFFSTGMFPVVLTSIINLVIMLGRAFFYRISTRGSYADAIKRRWTVEGGMDMEIEEIYGSRAASFTAIAAESNMVKRKGRKEGCMMGMTGTDKQDIIENDVQCKNVELHVYETHRTTKGSVHTQDWNINKRTTKGYEARCSTNCDFEALDDSENVISPRYPSPPMAGSAGSQYSPRLYPLPPPAPEESSESFSTKTEFTSYLVE